jgi:hypothetical protein
MLQAGARLGPYEVVSALGAGGMGEVWRARDTRLRREVALKVLPARFAHDAERLGRLQREARLLAAVSHPNIATLFGIEESGGAPVLVMELVEGQPLSERLREGRLPLGEALGLAQQIAAALQAAHDKGILHRDLKPANVVVTEKGFVKLLDFGLAKALETESAGGASALSDPTRSAPATEAGQVLGTPCYMSPEQLKGREVDKRTDVWAFGCVLYEMLTGRRAFPHGSWAETASRVLEYAPDWDALPRETPAGVSSLLRRCLEKSSDDRLRDVGDARLELLEAQTGGNAPVLSPRRRWVAPVSLVACAAAIAGVAAWRMSRSLRPTPATVARFTLALPPLSPGALSRSALGGNLLLAVSPDGQRLVYCADDDGGSTLLYLRELNAFDSKPLPGTAGCRTPFFSPDGRWIGFQSGDGVLRKLSVSGGPPLEIGRAPAAEILLW